MNTTLGPLPHRSNQAQTRTNQTMSIVESIPRSFSPYDVVTHSNVQDVDLQDAITNESDDDQLASLMDDYVRATQLQIC
jgi:hypothetical protein